MAPRSQFGLALSPPTDRTCAVLHHHSWCGTQRRKMLPPAGIQISAVQVGINITDAHREYPHTIVSIGNCVAVRACPNPTGTTRSGNQKSHCAISPSRSPGRCRCV